MQVFWSDKVELTASTQWLWDRYQDHHYGRREPGYPRTGRQLRKELIALADGFRESSESWAALLRDCKRRGMRAP
ncbi:MAG TPA: hypothetical protein VGW40_13920, partial [Allosphingosinicella sp.]|nr:hypothetical protein [Allosphingosinicella sp.]